MRLFNKIIESTKEPLNQNDIWFDGETFNIYTQGKWRAITITLQELGVLKALASNLSPDTNEDVESVWNNIINN